MHRALLLPLALLCLSPASSPAPLQEPITGKLAKHALFSRLALTSVGDTGPNLRLLVEAPRRASATHEAAVEQMLGPWLAQLDLLFIANYIEPNTLERNQVPEVGVVVLANVPAFTNAKRYETEPNHLSATCLYLEDPGVVVGLWNERMSRVPVDQVRAPIFERVVARTFASYHQGTGDLPTEQWVIDGVAGYFAGCGVEATPEDMANPSANAGAVERTAALLADPRQAEMLLPLAVLVENSTEQQRLQVGGSRARESGAAMERDAVLQLFRDQAALWVHFLERGEGGRFLKNWHHYVAKVLHDNGSADELANTLGASIAELEEGFRQHLQALIGGEDMGPGGPVEVDEGPILNPDLIEPAATLDEVLADALGRAALGDLDLSLAYLEAGLNALRGDDRGRIAAERDRLRVVRESRDAFLASLVGDRRRLRWTTAAGESASAQVESLTDGVLTLKANKYDVSSMGVNEVRAGDLARSMGSKAEEYGPSWVRPYLQLLGGEERWNKKLDTSTSEGALLASQTNLPGLVIEGTTRARLGRLAREPIPQLPAKVRAFLVELESLAGHETSPAIMAAQEGLRALAVQVLGVQWDTAGLARRLHGKVTNEGGGRVKIVYEFDDPAELEDFAPIEGYLADRSARLPKLAAIAKPGWRIRGGNLEAIGAVALRHLAGLEAPLIVDYQLVYGRAGAGQKLNATILVGVCDDSKGGYVGAWDVFDLDAIDPSTGFVRTAYELGERVIPPAKTLDVRLEHAGRKAILKVGGKVKREIVTGRRNTGTTLLWAHTDALIAVRRLEIRGKVMKSEDDPAKQAWIEAELRKLGL